MQTKSIQKIFGILLIIFALVWLSACSGKPQGVHPTATYTLAPVEIQRTVAECTAQSQAVPEMVAETDHAAGLEQGYSVTIIVYNDFACPTCMTTERALTDALLYYPEDIRLVFRHFADLENPMSVMAAKVAEAVGLQDRFWDIHSLKR